MVGLRCLFINWWDLISYCESQFWCSLYRHMQVILLQSSLICSRPRRIYQFFFSSGLNFSTRSSILGVRLSPPFTAGPTQVLVHYIKMHQKIRTRNANQARWRLRYSLSNPFPPGNTLGSCAPLFLLVHVITPPAASTNTRMTITAKCTVSTTFSSFCRISANLLMILGTGDLALVLLNEREPLCNFVTVFRCCNAHIFHVSDFTPRSPLPPAPASPPPLPLPSRFRSRFLPPLPPPPLLSLHL